MSILQLDPPGRSAQLAEGLSLPTQIKLKDIFVTFSIVFRCENGGYKARALAGNASLECRFRNSGEGNAIIYTNTREKVLEVGYIRGGDVYIYTSSIIIDVQEEG